MNASNTLVVDNGTGVSVEGIVIRIYSLHIQKKYAL